MKKYHSAFSRQHFRTCNTTCESYSVADQEWNSGRPELVGGDGYERDGGRWVEKNEVDTSTKTEFTIGKSAPSPPTSAFIVPRKV